MKDLPPIIAQLFDEILKYRVDPSGEHYGITQDWLREQIAMLHTDTIHAVDSDGKVDYNPILQSFVMGCGGQITYWDKIAHSTTPVVIRGVTKRKVMEACRAHGRDFYYIDTGYFGNPVKGKLYHRITRNDVQYFGPIMDRPNDRLAQTGIGFKKFRGGTNILLAPPSQKLLMMYDIDLDTWLNNTIEEIKKYTDRPIVIRKKQSRAVRMTEDTMEMALAQDVHCLVTFSSSKGQDLQTETTISFRDSIFGREINLRLSDQTVTTRVPAGIKDGAKIKLKGRGAPGQGGPGDLFITINVTKHPVYTRDGDNLLMTLPVTFDEAALGADIAVPTLQGEEVKVRLAPGTNNGKVLRLKGRGVTRNHASGDLLITIEVTVPQRLDAKAKKALEEFAEATSSESPRKDIFERARA